MANACKQALDLIRKCPPVRESTRLKFTLSSAGVSHSFTGYGDGWVAINGEAQHASLLLLVEAPPMPWVRDFDALQAEDFSALLSWRPELVVFGSGLSFRLPHPRLTRALPEAGIGFEAMDTRAACRTFNVLAAEGRRVLAAILIP